jgi:hypothetical protein
VRQAVSTFFLNKQETALVKRPMNGKGGFNTFGRHLQRILKASGEITLTDCECGEIMRIARYAMNDGGNGGIEGRLRLAFGRHLAAPFVCELRSLDPALFEG